MAAAKTGLILSGLSSSGACLLCYSSRRVNAQLCPLFIQSRYKSKNQKRYKAPSEPKQKEKWSNVGKGKGVTIETKKVTHSPEFLARIPVDDVWIRACYPRQKFSMVQAIQRHQEFADPSMLDNMEGFVYADMELSMKTKKKTKFLSSVKGTILLPYQFEQNLDKKIAIFCKKEEDVEKAMSLGASFVGCEDLVKQMLEGLVDKDDVDVVLCTPDVITELIPIRSQLKDKFPNKVKGSVGTDIEEMWKVYTQGVTYTSQKVTDAVSKLQVPLGQLKMPVDQLESNFQAYIDMLYKGRPKGLDPLITQIFVVAPPSRERFLLQIENYVPGYEKTETRNDEADDSEDEEDETSQEKR